ncbi:hypothetical protein CVT25_004493 [Psilocybe cyanescens]|uniref:Ubiquitin-like domain-containing protein n=1 Tax=Psilocybe cyanescens TaxID=93625 RepID=A0A409XRU8_PSICY|nr:hypothetical protein CVT25_004493 [Psilocybe cyanescens]
MSNTANFFAGAREFVIKDSQFMTNPTIIHNTYIYQVGSSEHERIGPIAATRRIVSTSSPVTSVVPRSFGDIVTTINIVQSIYNALSDSAGSSSLYMSLIEELRSFEKVLFKVDQLLTTTPVDDSVHQAVEIETADCLKMLRTFWERIERYQGVLGLRWSLIWPKVTWAIYKASEIKKFRRILCQHQQRIGMFLSGLQAAIVSSGVGVMRQDLTSIKQQVAEIRTNQQRPFIGVGYGLENALVLINAFGERITLSMEFCWSQTKLHETLIGLYNGKIGQDYVARLDYSISTEDGLQVATSSNWGTVVEQGKVIIMSMIVKRIALKRIGHQKETCPRCYRTKVGVMRDNGWLKCRRCERRFGWNEKTYSLVPPSQDPSITDFRNIRVVPVKRVKRSVLDLWIWRTLIIPYCFCIYRAYVALFI